MNSSTSPKPEPKPFWKDFYYLMLAVSLALHGLLLAIPMPERPPVAETPPEEEPEEIRLSSLTAPSTPRPTPAQPRPTVTAKPAASPQVVVRPPVPQLAPASPPPRPVAPSPTPQAAPSPSPIAASPTPAPLPTPDPYSEPFQDSLASAAGAVQGQGIPYYKFPQPQLFFTPESLQQADANGTDPTPVEGSNPQWVSNVGVQDIIQKLPELFPGTSIAEVGEYGGGKLYEARQGSAIRYISVIEGAGSGLTTFVVTWSRDPRQPASPAPVSQAPSP